MVMRAMNMYTITMNLLDVITALSFGCHFPDITQPSDNSFESTDKRFVAYQYFLHVVLT
ncbi:uncharacterized protein LACBIDRAFT_296110 [Laccaria bicolor S238N-H82]|uniref:Predicted protein n=1 Tax=Laccaria bicolor (strain S238N-H82 / ATCC MYA-4686) TaxID=486041 RepID=B0E2V0_LACBS|nr:uncharacterized protein LACBIDRAFT_296110 [Laccaria bicolor S238N-H82]EDQ98833.1 predicted protein [Laccaria bicolor S238N-H82]|eukprot:XP_001890519.1 predicted protein [Laccaria bicolor S238N-H82]